MIATEVTPVLWGPSLVDSQLHAEANRTGHAWEAEKVPGRNWYMECDLKN